MALEQVRLGCGEADEVFTSYELLDHIFARRERSCRTDLSDLGVAMVQEFHQL